MKKMFFALAVLVLAFTGCSQEEDAIQVSEKKAIKVVVNMDKPGFGEDTRAARTGWVAGDQVVVMLGNDLEHLISLTYDGTGWEEEVWFFHYDGEEYLWTNTGAAATDSYLASLNSGSLNAIYCSTGISYPLQIPDYAETVEDLEGIDIYSYAREKGMGECIMTCEDGEYSVSGGVLTLTITMVPQVAQFTIRDLSDGEGDDKGKTSEGLEVGVAGGNLITYAGATIDKTEGIILEPLVGLNHYNACWVHPNADGISIYASVDAEANEFGAEETYTFYVGDDYIRHFNCNAYKDDIYNRAAIKMDGPYTDGAAEKWSQTME